MNTTAQSQSETVGELPVIARVRLDLATTDFTLVVDWKGGGSDRIVFAGLIASDPLFAPLAEIARFAIVEVVHWGGGVDWGDGIELSSDTLKRMADAQRPMTNREFADMQKTWGISNQSTADLLGRSLSMVKEYKSGRHPIPLTVATSLRAMADPIIFAAHYRPPAKPGRPHKRA